MPNIYGLLDIGRNALLSQQKAIDITGNNIANVHTPGYSRQRINLEQSTPVRDQGATMSRGVRTNQAIQRFYDKFLADQLNNENANLGRWEAQKNALEKVEVMFDDISGYGVSGAMSEFWNAWQDLTNNPSGFVERTSLLSASQHLTSTFTQLRENIVGVQEDIDDQVDNIVADINRLAAQIAELNRKVVQEEVSGYNANDYRDQRDLLVFELANLIDIDSFEDGDGNIAVMVGGGRPLVEGAKSWTMSTADNGGVQDVFWQDSSGTLVNITSQITGGELKGWTEARDVLISDYLNRLDTLAGGIISEVNTLHIAGYALDGSQNNFFTGSDASDMAVNSSIVADINLIAASGTLAGLPGDNSTAIAIANLQSALTMSANTTTFDQYYSSLVGKVGSDVRSSNLNHEHQTAMMKQLETHRQEISGVSLDEEMVNLVKYQHAYNAAAKLITTTDELLDSLMSIKR